MFKKFSSGILILILAVLMIIYIIVRYSGSDERTFRDKIITIDPLTITEIGIKDPRKADAVNLKLSGTNWFVSQGSTEFMADTNIVKKMLDLLSNMPTKRYAGKGQDAWVKYELTDSTASLVTLKSLEKTLAEIYIGKFSYNMAKGQQPQAQSRQQRGDMTTYVRLANEKEVYAVEGFLKMSFSSDINAYRIRNQAEDGEEKK